MKMIVLMYLEDDEEIVVRLMEDRGISSFSSVKLEGHGRGSPGWYGDVAPYQSRMIFAVLPEVEAEALLRAVGELGSGSHPEHPIHGIQMAVEKTVNCR
ncbi:MAG: hypothetical protein R3223_00615 [Longimicrobiales bacterium]|nr:hypothetical protein [Longimicrobiales bacterium]